MISPSRPAACRILAAVVLVLASLVAAALLAACADHPRPATPMRDGWAVAAPGGWADYCGRHATDDPRCKPSR
jgi:predicted transglutaminase-like cysteine proteinase